jgi:hypothetical protein
VHIADTYPSISPRLPATRSTSTSRPQDADSSVYVVVDAMECCDGVARHAASLPDMALEMPISYGAHILSANHVTRN